MAGRLVLSDQGIFIRVDEERSLVPGVQSRSARNAVRAVQSSATGKGAALAGENLSTVPGVPVLLLKGHGDIFRAERWTGAAWEVVATISADGTLDVADFTVAGNPIAGAGPIEIGDLVDIAASRMVGNVTGSPGPLVELDKDTVTTWLALAAADISGLGNLATATTLPVSFGIACSDETTTITTGDGKATFRLPHAMTLTAVRASLTTASTSGAVTVDINEGGTTVLSTALTLDQDEKTSTTAATAAVISDSTLADDAEIRIDIDGAGTGAKGLKVWLIGTRAVP